LFGASLEFFFFLKAALFAGGSGYAPYLTSRPRTLSYGLLDSPVAQLAWLVERFKEFDGCPVPRPERPTSPSIATSC